MDEAISGRAVEIRIQTRQANRQSSVRGKAAAEQLAAIAANEYGFYANGILPSAIDADAGRFGPCLWKRSPPGGDEPVIDFARSPA